MSDAYSVFLVAFQLLARQIKFRLHSSFWLTSSGLLGIKQCHSVVKDYFML